MNVTPVVFIDYELKRKYDKIQETSKWDGMGFLMEFSKHLPELPEDIIVVIGEYISGELDMYHQFMYPPKSEFYSVEPRYYKSIKTPVLTKPCLVLGQTSRRHRKQMRLLNIEFRKAYEIIKDRLYYQSEEYYDSCEYQEELDDENEERMRDAWKDGWDN